MILYNIVLDLLKTSATWQEGVGDLLSFGGRGGGSTATQWGRGAGDLLSLGGRGEEYIMSLAGRGWGIYFIPIGSR